MTIHRVLTPPGWPRGRGYSHGIEAQGSLVFVAGQVGWDESRRFPETLLEQLRNALANTVAILAEAGAGPEHIVRMTWYLLDKREYLSRSGEVGSVYREMMGGSYPAMAVVEVKGLVEEGALLEIETTAVVPRD
ncbi:MAG TPA: RidA family protein [Vicinamibacteria bacterium]|nr:RidA family protein [Vicinamibacteria bacterium]